MIHYMINVPVTQEQVEIIKEQLMPYTEKSDGFMLVLNPMNEKVDPPSIELSDTVVNVFMQLLAQMVRGKFEGVH